MMFAILGFLSMNFAPITVDRPSSQNSAEEVAGFSFFRTHRQGKSGITATWGMDNVGNVASYVLRKTYEDPYDPYAEWFVVTTLANTSARSFKFTDENVSPGMISYQVVAFNMDGSTLASGVITQRIMRH